MSFSFLDAENVYTDLCTPSPVWSLLILSLMVGTIDNERESISAYRWLSGSVSRLPEVLECLGAPYGLGRKPSTQDPVGSKIAMGIHLAATCVSH